MSSELHRLYRWPQIDGYMAEESLYIYLPFDNFQQIDYILTMKCINSATLNSYKRIFWKCLYDHVAIFQTFDPHSTMKIISFLQTILHSLNNMFYVIPSFSTVSHTYIALFRNRFRRHSCLKIACSCLSVWYASRVLIIINVLVYIGSIIICIDLENVLIKCYLNTRRHRFADR